MAEQTSIFPNISRLISGQLNFSRLREQVPGAVSTLNAIEQALKKRETASPEEISSWHQAPNARDYSRLTAEEMELLKSEPARFLAEHPQAALGFDMNAVERGNVDAANTHITIKYQDQNGNPWNLVFIMPRFGGVCTQVRACDDSRGNQVAKILKPGPAVNSILRELAS